VSSNTGNADMFMDPKISPQTVTGLPSHLRPPSISISSNPNPRTISPSIHANHHVVMHGDSSAVETHDTDSHLVEMLNHLKSSPSPKNLRFFDDDGKGKRKRTKRSGQTSVPSLSM
jgi:hypothetical protein